MILDSDILIWVLRQHPGTIAFVEGIPLAERKVTVVSYLELLYGCRDKVELRNLIQHVTTKYAEVVELSENVTRTAARLMEKFALSRRPGVHDVLVAATALVHGEEVATGNVKHFNFVPGLVVRSFRP